MSTIQTTPLDFDTIKNSLKVYFEAQDEFADYDFEGSGLSNILDVLAYNTHYNSLASTFALNESYLSSAQLRSSVISIAQTLGYTVRSRSSASANVEISVNLSDAVTKPSSITIPANTQFTTNIDGILYTFQTRESYSAMNDSGVYTFETSSGSTSIPIYEGTLKTKTFIVDQSDDVQVFIIPDQSIDTSIIDVKVYDTFNASTYTTYTSIFGVANIDNSSTLYNIVELPNGYYQLGFGDGITTGKSPEAGNKVVIEYLSCKGSDANGASVFSPVSNISINSVSYPISVVTNNSSYGGAERESISSIKQNAPLAFSSQQRLVTADDYKGMILSTFSTVSDAIAWGGEDNDPPDYGKVFVGLNFDDNIPSSVIDTIKTNISSTLSDNLAILSIDTEFVDPVKIYLELQNIFDYNPNLIGSTQSAIENSVLSIMKSYVDTNLKTFGGIFRKSNLLTDVDGYSEAILSNKISVKIQNRLVPVSTQTSYTISYPIKISEPDDEVYVISSDTFQYNSQTCLLRNKLSSEKIQVVTNTGVVIVDNIGCYDASTGKIMLEGFSPGTITSGNEYIKISIIPENESTIKPLRNYILDIDETKSFATGIADRQTTAVEL